MKEFVEIIFEKGSLTTVRDLIDANPFDRILTEDDKKDILCLIDDEKNSVVDVGFYDLRINDFVLKDARIRLLKHEGMIDLEINYEISCPLQLEFVNNLQVFANSLKELYGFDRCAMGIDSAFDLETNYFINQTLGPLAKKN